MAEPIQLCRAVKHGGVDLICTLSEDHDGWHEGDYISEDKRVIRYHGSRHTIETTTHEHVEWEPLDHVKEAVRHLMTNRRRDTP